MADASLCESGIYCIRNLVSGRRYVGSASNFEKRWRLHLRNLQTGDHHSRILQASWNKHGESAFVFQILEYVGDRQELLKREQFWIDAIGAATQDRGLNVLPVAGSSLGRPQTASARAKIAAARLGTKKSLGELIRRSMKRLGKKHSPTTLALMHDNRSGKPQRSKRAMTFETAQEIRRLREGGLSTYKLAAQFGCSRHSVREILAGRTYTAP